jgi:hypothetical protein
MLLYPQAIALTSRLKRFVNLRFRADADLTQHLNLLAEVHGNSTEEQAYTPVVRQSQAKITLSTVAVAERIRTTKGLSGPQI